MQLLCTQNLMHGQRGLDSSMGNSSMFRCSILSIGYSSRDQHWRVYGGAVCEVWVAGLAFYGYYY